jgi:glycosyl transferase family 87
MRERVGHHPPGHWIAALIYGRTRAAKRARRIALTLGVAHGLLSLLMPLAALFPPIVYGKDVMQEYVLARAVADGTDPYLPVRSLAARYVPGSLEQGGSFAFPTPHPPPVGLLVFPLGLTDYRTAATGWFVLEIGCLLAAVWLLARHCRVAWSFGRCALAALILIGWAPFYWELFFGQLMVLLLLLLAGARAALRSGHCVKAGVLVGLAILIKTVPWPFLIIFAIRRDWRTLFAASATAAIGYVATALALGPARLIEYFTRVAPELSRLYQGSAVNLSAWAVGWRLFDGTPTGAFGGFNITAPPVIAAPWAAAVMSFVIPIGLFAVICFWSRHSSLDAAFGASTCLAMLVSPIAWAHYLVLVCIPAAYVIEWLIRHRFPARETSLALALAVLFAVPYEAWEIAASLLAGQMPVEQTTSVLPALPALITFMPSLALVLLIWLIAHFSAQESSAAVVLNSRDDESSSGQTSAVPLTAA